MNTNNKKNLYPTLPLFFIQVKSNLKLNIYILLVRLIRKKLIFKYIRQTLKFAAVHVIRKKKIALVGNLLSR